MMWLQSARGPGQRALGVSGADRSRIDSDDDTAPPPQQPVRRVLTDDILTSHGRTIRPKSLGQKAYTDAIEESTITFGIGPAGTGKTYLAMATAVDALAYFDHPSSSNGPTEAVNGRLEHLRGIALGIRNLASSSPAASSTQDASRTASLQKTAAQIAAIVAVILTPK